MKLKIRESNGNMTIREFCDRAKEIYDKYFSNSMCNARLYKGLGKAITIDCYLAGSIDEFPNKISHNDMFNISFWIHDIPKDAELDSELPEVITLTSDRHNYAIAPTNKYLYAESRNVVFRKTIGSPEKCLQAFERFVKKLYDSVKTDLENGTAHPNYIELLNTKI